jgi:hypothetical protein
MRLIYRRPAVGAPKAKQEARKQYYGARSGNQCVVKYFAKHGPHCIIENVNIGEGYLDKMKTRRKDSRVSQPYQLIGLEIADILGDRKHKALYIKLAKEKNPIELLRLAKEVEDAKGVKNKGAYFMRILTGDPDKKDKK